MKMQTKEKQIQVVIMEISDDTEDVKKFLIERNQWNLVDVVSTSDNSLWVAAKGRYKVTCNENVKKYNVSIDDSNFSSFDSTHLVMFLLSVGVANV